jgi:hypothetical protein
VVCSKKKLNKMAFNKKWKLKYQSSNKTHDRQVLENLEQRISLNIDSFFVLSEEGDPAQIALAHQRAKNELMKLGPQMYQIAKKIGGDLQLSVNDFLESVHTVLYGQGMLNEDLISHCLTTAARLKAELK